MTPGYGDRLVTAPAWEPITLAQAKAHCRVRASHTADDAMFDGVWIPAAREWVETVTRRAIPQQTWELTYDQFPGRQVDDYRPPTWRYGIIRFPRPPLISVDAVSYIGPADTTVYTATTEFQTDTNTEPGRCAPAAYKVWPTTNPLVMKAVKIQYTCGYASAALVPARLKQAVLLMVGHLYENREATAEVAMSRVPFSLRSFAMAAAPWEYK